MFESKSPFAHMLHILLWLSTAHHMFFLLNQFSAKYRFPFPSLHFLTVKSLSVTQRSVFKKMFLKRAKTCCFLFAKL